MSRFGLVLSGGGSRAAYQAGVARALAELKYPIQDSIISGFSAGAINATYIASISHDFLDGTEKLQKFWSSLSTDQVFCSEISKLVRRGFRLIWDLSFGGVHRHTSTRGLLDTSPLRQLLEE